jgi:hypothetical protein
MENKKCLKPPTSGYSPFPYENGHKLGISPHVWIQTPFTVRYISSYILLHPHQKKTKTCWGYPMKAQENPMKSACSIHFHPFSMIGRNPNCGLGPWEPWSDPNPEDLDPVPRGWCTSHPGGRKSNPETWLPGGSYGWFNGLSHGQIMILSWEKAKKNATMMGVFTNITGDLSDWMGWVCTWEWGIEWWNMIKWRQGPWELAGWNWLFSMTISWLWMEFKQQ